jgi:hypothetical protein
VITYATLLDAAERALAFEDTARTQRRQSGLSSDDEPSAAAPSSPWDDEPPF